MIAFHRSFRLYEVSQRPYYFASTPPTCHKLFCFTMFPFSLPAVLILLADLQVDPAKCLLITQKDLSQRRAGTSNHNTGLPIPEICTPDKLEQQQVSFSCTATSARGDAGLGWSQRLRGTRLASQVPWDACGRAWLLDATFSEGRGIQACWQAI